MAAPVVWVTGAGGLIGSYLVRTATKFAPEFQVIGFTRGQLELTDLAAVRQAFRDQSPQAVIHCAALSKSPACQAEPAVARKINVDVTRCLAELAAKTQFIFFSTDLVFDGRQGNYDETAKTNPLSVYAETKVAAERIVLANPRHTVIRASLNGGTSPTGDRGFNEELRRGWREGRRLSLFADEFRSPLPAVVTARAVWELVAKQLTGLFHIAGSERLSRFEIGQLVAARWPQLNPVVEAGSLKNYPGAPRPPDTSLNCAKVQRELSFRLPGLREWLAENPDEPF
ncbi:MAG: SDR family oxidoreductase [Verrucomicrobia bacterium]|nr:SDR family oxidoreductase [Verrucomicrobiota bacterium]